MRARWRPASRGRGARRSGYPHSQKRWRRDRALPRLARAGCRPAWVDLGCHRGRSGRTPSGRRHPLRQLLADDDLLDLRGALVDPEDPHVAVEALDRTVAHIARTTMDLDGAIGDATDHLRAEHLRAGRLERDSFAGVVPSRYVAQHALSGIKVGLAVGEHRLDQLETADGFTELLTLY